VTDTYDDDIDAADEVDGNRATGAISRNVLEYIAKSIVDDPESVVVEVDERRSGVELRLHVAPDDMGKVIGKGGRTAKAIRAVVRAAATRQGINAYVDIAD
jgi:predicted RNA-binding protein YlqC (UPF0109 family)